MIHRIISDKVTEAAQKLPVIAVTGPRQSGKSTLVRHIFPNYPYANLEDIQQRQFATEDPRGFLQNLGDKAIIDEIQHVPDLLSYIQVIVDQDKTPGKYVISGSQNLLLMESVSQSLAGRVAIFNLLPFSLEEIKDTSYALHQYEDYVFKGFYPRLYDQDLDPVKWLRDYIQTYVERDLHQIVNVADLGTFRQFLEICAGRIGQMVNFSEIGSQIGVSYHTIHRWMNVLETSFIAYLLRPYHKNYNKRIVKTPKLYFYDTGLACALLNLQHVDDINRHFGKGALFENFIINEILKNHLHRGIQSRLYFWQATGRHEIDLLIDQGTHTVTVEIKSGRTINSDFFNSLSYFQRLSGSLPQNSFLVYGGEEVQHRSIARVLGWRHLDQIPLQ